MDKTELFEKINLGGVENLVKVVGSQARTEHVQEMNGNPIRHIAESRYTYLDGIANDGKGNECEVNAGAFVSPYVYKFPVRLDDKPVDWDQILNLDPMLRMTKGFFMIKYTPKGSRDYKKGRPWKIGQDMLRWDIRVSGPREWHELCKRVPELAWIQRNSIMSDRYFDIAAKHPGMTFFFTVDWLRYIDKLNAQVKKPLDQPLISHKCSVKDYIDIYKCKDKTILIRVFNDILKEVNEVEALPSVQEEMRTVSGEGYDRSRKCPRDPVTGQFIKKDNNHEEE